MPHSAHRRLLVMCTRAIAVLIAFLSFIIYLVLFQLETGLLQRRTLLGVSPQDRAAAVNQVRTVFHGQSANESAVNNYEPFLGFQREINDFQHYVVRTC